VLGGGQAALTAALQLTDPRNPAAADTELTIYQLGWRLGGKAATGRASGEGSAGPARILEHGQPQWFGFFDNAIGQLRAVYDELERPAGAPLATFDEAVGGGDGIYTVEWIEGQPLVWGIEPPKAGGTPGEGGLFLTPLEYLETAVSLIEQRFASSPFAGLTHETGGLLGRAHALLEAGAHGRGGQDPSAQVGARGRGGQALSAHGAHDLLRGAARIARSAASGGTEPIVEHVHRLTRELARLLPEDFELPEWIEGLADGALGAICALLRLFLAVLRRALPDDLSTIAHTEARRLWILANFGYACIAGAVRDRVLWDGFDTLNDRDFREWLSSNAYPDGGVLMASPVVELVYCSAFGYPRGDEHGDLCYPHAENIEAGVALRGMVRTLLTSKGGMALRLLAGSGDTNFAPIYEVLRGRGVDVRFFSRVERLELEDGRIVRVHYAEQAQTASGGSYQPLVEIAGLPCWPPAPRWEQLVDGAALGAEHADFEWPSAELLARERHLALEHGRDYDDIVLGIPIGALGTICADLVEAYPAWAGSLAHVQTVRTQTLTLWLAADARELGFAGAQKQTSGWRYAADNPLDAWTDFSELVGPEHWPAGQAPRAIAYFTSTMPDDPAQPLLDQASADERVRQNAATMLGSGLPVMMPGVLDRDGRFRWELLVDAAGSPVTGPARLRTQWARGNVASSDRYVISVVGSSRHRLAAHDPAGPANLYLAGDWTQCTMNCGCIEAATISGMLAANALCGYPARDAIVGVDF
jgi:uncharacterized protein with NAD-binding domain and iron-sulfur cluster